MSFVQDVIIAIDSSTVCVNGTWKIVDRKRLISKREYPRRGSCKSLRVSKDI